MDVNRLRNGCLQTHARIRSNSRAVRKADRQFPIGPGPAGEDDWQCNRSQCMVVCLSRMQDEGKLQDYHASLAKAFCAARMRETVAWAREVLGGNGILLDHQVARYFADAEALYSYEGTREMNTLIVGKAISGFSAFV